MEQPQIRWDAVLGNLRTELGNLVYQLAVKESIIQDLQTKLKEAEDAAKALQATNQPDS